MARKLGSEGITAGRNRFKIRRVPAERSGETKRNLMRPSNHAYVVVQRKQVRVECIEGNRGTISERGTISDANDGTVRGVAAVGDGTGIADAERVDAGIPEHRKVPPHTECVHCRGPNK